MESVRSGSALLSVLLFSVWFGSMILTGAAQPGSALETHSVWFCLLPQCLVQFGSVLAEVVFFDDDDGS